MAFGLFGNQYKIGIVVVLAVVTVGVANAALTDGLVGRRWRLTIFNLRLRD